MTPEQAEVVARIRAADEARRRAGPPPQTAEMRAQRRDAGLLGAAARRAASPTCITRVAARYAYMFGVSLPDAARVLGCSADAVRSRWHVLYPGVSAVVADRGATVR